MKQFITGFLKRWPPLYRAAGKIYWGLKAERLLERIIGTKARERHWAGRSFGQGYWANRGLPIMHLLAERMAAFAPVNSILEIGCASGPGLYQPARKFPEARIRGIDINREAVAYGNARFAREGLTNVTLSVGQADEMGEFPDGAFDIVFTNALLIFIGPDKIRGVVREMLRVARRAVVLVELSRPASGPGDPLGLGVYSGGSWVRDYRALLRPYVAEDRISVTKIPPGVWPAAPWGELGTIIEVTCAPAGRSA